MAKNKKWILAAVAVLAVVLCCWAAWSKWASTTRIGLVNFQNYQTASLVKSNEDNFIEYEEIPLDRLDRLGRYDLVLGFGMGLKITEEQRAQILAAADEGTPIYIYAATNPENDICSLDSLTKAGISAYIGNGNKRNYRNMARYVRQHIDAKRLFVTPAEEVVESASDVLYHLDEDLSFKTVADYEKYLREQGIYREKAPKIAIVGGLNDPFSGNRANIDSLIVSLQNAGMNVYPVSSYRQRLTFLREIGPDAVIHFAHGRMVMGQADAAVEWLKERNIPIFSPLSMLETQEEWESDPMGMFGGFMSQSIVVPELDGAIYPYVLNDQELDEEGIYLFKAIPERLKNFTRIIGNFISLKRKPNAEKKVAIYYFKGAGQSSLTAQGLETVPSLYNLLKRLKAEGYTVKNLPATEKEFEKLLMTQGAVLSTYAEGAFDDFLKNGRPALVGKSEYESWVQDALPEELYADVVQLYGEAPGRYMSTVREGEPCLAVARIDLGNVVLLPQPMAAVGDDAFAIVHGAKTAPPHPYIGAYLWAQYGFGADAMIHFGTHGSLEFTPRKQVALCRYDWPDRLVGTIPHFYYYTIGNVGESMMAKRRSYATTISYLTPPFTESKTRGQYKELMNKIEAYYKTDEARQPEVSIAVKKIAVKMGLHRDLRLDSLLTQPYTAEEIARIENFAEEIANEKDDRAALYDRRSLLAGEDPFVGNGHERRPDRIQRSGPRPPARKGNRHAAQESGILHAALSGAGQTTGPPGTRRTESRRRTGLPRSGNHPGEARRSAHDPHSAPARYDDGPRSYSYGIYGRSKTRSAGHRRSGAYRDEYPELQTGAGGESGNGDALDSERSGGRIRRTNFGRRCRGQSAGGAYGPQPLCCERRDHPVRTGLGQGQGAGGEYARTIQENARRLSAQSQLHLLE